MNRPRCRPSLGQANPPSSRILPNSIIPLKLTWMSCSLMITGGAMGFPQTTEVDSAGVQQPSCAHHRIRILGSAKGRSQRCGPSVLLHGTRDFPISREYSEYFFFFFWQRNGGENLRAMSRPDSTDSSFQVRSRRPKKKKALAVEAVTFHRCHQKHSQHL